MKTGARLALVTACFLWAVSFIATKVALESAPPLTVVSLRLLISALCFVLWLSCCGGIRVRLSRAVLWQLFVLSLLGTGLHYGVQTIGLQFTSAANASLYAVTAPITIVVLAAVVLRERIGWQKVLGVLTAVVGVLVVIGPAELARFKLEGHVLGDVLVLISIAMWGLFTVYGKRVTDELGALTVTALVTIIGAGWMLPVGLVELRVQEFSLAAISLRGWLAIGFLGVTCSFLATLLYFVALAGSESQKVGVYLYTIPPQTALLSWLFLGERLSLSFVIGAVLVLAGVALTERG